LEFRVTAWGRECVILQFIPRINEATIDVCPSNAAALEGVALVQAVMDEGLAQTLHGVGKHVDIRILDLGMVTKLTRTDFQAMIAPLIRLIPPCKRTLATVWWRAA
jgi:hypothetical protein